MSTPTSEQPDSSSPKVEAGALPPWDVGNLPPSPPGGWRIWVGTLVILSGVAIVNLARVRVRTAD